MAVTCTIKNTVVAAQTSVRDVADGSISINYTKTTALTDGAAAGNVNVLFDDDRTLGVTANEVLDLAGGIVDGFNNTLTFARVKTIFVENKSSGGNITIGGATATGFVGPLGNTNHTYTVRSLGVWSGNCSDATGYVVSAGASDSLLITNNAPTAQIYRIILTGCST